MTALSPPDNSIDLFYFPFSAIFLFNRPAILFTPLLLMTASKTEESLSIADSGQTVPQGVAALKHSRISVVSV
jgi:hypothetical protein